MVSFVERGHTVKLVSFCSNHILGTALPSPSVGGLRLNSPVTCGFASSHPALSRRQRAVAREPPGSLGRARASRQGARPQPAAIRGCSVRADAHLLCSPRRHAPAGVRPGSPPPSRPRSAPPHPRAAPAGARPSSPRALRSPWSSFISELASHEVPGFGAPALPSALGLEAFASALVIARDHGVLRFRPAVAILPPPPRASLLANQVPRRGHLHPYKGTRGARIVSARRAELMRSFRGCRSGGLYVLDLVAPSWR